MSVSDPLDSTGKPSDRRKLIAVVHADMVGYSRLIGLDDVGTLERLRTLRSTLIDPAIAEHGGRIANTGGDSLLIVFDSIDGAVRCALKVQQQVPAHDRDQPPDRAVRFRIGVNIGDVIPDGADIHGDTVNVAARLQAECPPGGVCITRAVRDHVQDRLDLSFEELGALNLKNITRPVEAFVVRLCGERSLMTDSRRGLPLPGKPSIAVLAFANMSGDRDQEYFGDGIADDIIMELSRSPSLFVIARSSSFTYKGKAVGIKQVAQELGVSYVLEGSVRRSDKRVRVAAQLIDAETDKHVWAERYDRDVQEVFAVQDEIAEAVAIAIEPAVAESERRRAVRKPSQSLSAWEAYQRGLWHMARLGASENESAKHFLMRSIDLDPNFASAHGVLAAVILTAAVIYQTRSVADVLAEAEPIARRAVSLDPLNAMAHVAMCTSLLLRGDYSGALTEAGRAIAVTPNSAAGHSSLGTVLVFSGQPRPGLESISKAIRLDPFATMPYNRLLCIAIAYYFLREYDAAIRSAQEAIQAYPDYHLAPRWLAAALAQAGQLPEARHALRKAIEMSQDSFEMYVHQRVPWHRPEDYEHLLDGLRKAGWQG